VLKLQLCNRNRSTKDLNAYSKLCLLEQSQFVNPIFTAGLTLNHSTGREAAYSVLDLHRGELNAVWQRSRGEEA